LQHASKFGLGGTLRITAPDVPFSSIDRLDPQKDYIFGSWELFRCCLLRTLLSFEGAPTRNGGTILRPDLATSLPSVSADGLTWTFHLRRGIHYAPPLQHLEVSSTDIIRALLREANPTASKGGYSSYYSVIAGFEDVAKGRAQSIPGLEAPDPHTLRVHLVHPEGDLGQFFALAATAPIPPNPFDPSARLGVAEGHDGGDGGLVVTTGPYMIQGADSLDFSKPPAEQEPAAGLVPGKSVVLVRNPSWKRSTDHLRPAYVDRIDVTIGGTFEQASKQLDRGATDLVVVMSPQPPPDLALYRSSSTRGRIDVEPRDSVRYVSMNLAIPPFDDVHVRRAVNLAIDRQAALDSLGGSDEGQVAGHIAVDSLENDLLLNFDPYRTPGEHGDMSRARAEMAQSRYDSNHDGICDAPACEGVVALTLDSPIMVAASKAIARNLRGIGVDIRVEPKADIFDLVGNPAKHIPMAIEIAWLKDIPSASNFITPLFNSPQLEGPPEANGNYSLLGATPEQLARWRYRVRSVPSVDDRIAQCQPTRGSAQFSCWASLDQYLMTDIVPWVPLVSESHLQIVPARLAHYSYDQFTDEPALDQIALKRSP
jgi:peptide/nickel transport system substrate-binding protein